MAKVKYIPVEIDGQNILEPIERLLKSPDVDVAIAGFPPTDVESSLVYLQQEIESISVGSTNWDLALVTTDNWTVLVDYNGNILAKGFI